MADVKITGLTAGTVKSTDVYPAVDITDPTQAPSGTTKKYTIAQLQTFLLSSPVPITSGGTNKTSFTAYSLICGGTTSTSSLQSVSGLGTSGQVLTSNGAGVLPTWQSGNKVVQQVRTQLTTTLTGSTVLPVDNNIPQNTQGDQYITLSITPTNVSNILWVTGQLLLSNNQNGLTMAIAAFQDSNVNAFGSVYNYQSNANDQNNLAYSFYVVAGTTSSTTIKIRAGGTVAGTSSVNGNTMGGTAFSSLVITELTP